MIKIFFSLLTEFKLNKCKKKDYFYTKYCAKKLIVIKILLNYNLISYVKYTEIDTIKLIKIYINYNTTSSIHVLNSMAALSTKKAKLTHLLLKEKTIYIYSTSQGIITTNNINNITGGILLFSINN